ncbi:hypothetical protein HN51_039880 [Arachis hypogaea]|uniref:ATP synthase delta chain n=1 Tax=Arachis hypogaea TaxID=3818 RepID=A0A444YLJ4_ARAHY|nr:uncharacterized protein LOC107646102 [Arachis ipaensis]XP_025662988.1 uncharacterized protein LOC112758506 [Arachis hypogaea]QHN85520.1 ATP synthase delta chain [Arachis hypogaea]RYR02719.1 hypothetical protein Ahy_B06g081522 [Arachis hypogaea]
MDTLSSTVSTLKIPSVPTQTHHHRELFYHHLIRTNTHNCQPCVSSSTASIIPRTSKKAAASTFLPVSASSSSPPLQPRSSSPIFHAKPSTGYAAAIIEVAQSTKSLHAVHMDVQRLLRFLQSSNNNDKGEAAATMMMMKEVGKQGKFQRHVVALLRMLMKKGKLGILGEVLKEFERIYEELCGTQVVLVSSEELLGIAKKVRQTPSFAL